MVDALESSMRGLGMENDELEGHHEEDEYDEEEDDCPQQTNSSYHSQTRVESAQILSQKYSIREKVKQEMLAKERQKRIVRQRRKQAKVSKWQSKTKRSPFMVDLVAENERIDEENRIRIREEQMRLKQMEKKKTKVKNDIILKALAEASDLDMLREEKRMIQLEEKRLKALLDLEKTNASRKSDLLAAKHAENRRKKAKADFRRAKKRTELEERNRKYQELLKDKLDIHETESPRL